MKAGWQTNTLEDVCQFSNGLWKGEKPPFVKVGVIRNTNFTKEGTLDYSDIAYLDVEAKKLEKRRLKFGDVILEKSGGGPKQPVGRVVLFDKAEGNFSFSNFTSTLRVIDPEMLDFRFLHKFLHWTYLSGVTEGMQSHSTGIRNLDGDAYKSIKISFPPLHEQQHIVRLLDQAFDGIATAKANTEKNLHNTRALFESHLHAIFTQGGEGWEEKRLDELAELRGRIGWRGLTAKEYTKSGPLFLSVYSLNYGDYVDFRDAFHISEERYKESPEIILQPDDVLICKDGAGIGKLGIVGTLPDKATINSSLLLIRSGKSIHPKFLYWCLSSPYFQKIVNSRLNGATTPHLYQRDITEFPVFLPSFSDQRRIVAKLDLLRAETRRLASLYQRKFAALDELKKSLLHQAFNGEM